MLQMSPSHVTGSSEGMREELVIEVLPHQKIFSCRSLVERYDRNLEE